MAYSLTSSERISSFTSVGDYDAPSEPEYTFLSDYYLAPGFLNIGYGATVPVQNYFLKSADIDFYSLVSLSIFKPITIKIRCMLFIKYLNDDSISIFFHQFVYKIKMKIILSTTIAVILFSIP